ncbi:hypothetical protein SLA2020_347670 [Shorea laevis]
MEQKMGGGGRAGKEIAASSPSPPPPLSSSFVRAVWDLLRVSVDVHLKDGSVFSGIFLTVSPEKNIVLKEAKLTKRGRSRSNVASEAVVGTLVIRSGDIVKVVCESKKNVLSFDDVAAFDDVAENSQKFSFSEQESPGEVQASNLSSKTRLIPVKPIGVGEGNAEKTCSLLHSGASHDATAGLELACFERRPSEDTFPDVVQSSVSTSSTHISDVTLESFGSSVITTVEMAPPQNSESNESSKYAPVPQQPEYAGQYHPAQVVPPVNDPNFQAEAMTAQLGPIVYMQPAIYGAAGMPRGPSLTPHHIQHQGNAAFQASQFYVPQPYPPTGQQPFAVPGQVQAGQPSFPPTHPIPGPPASNRP